MTSCRQIISPSLKCIDESLLKACFQLHLYVSDFKASACKTLKAPDHGSTTITNIGDIVQVINATCNDGYVPRTSFAPRYVCFCESGRCLDSATMEKVTSLPNCIRKCFILLKLHCIVVLNLSILILC